MVKMDQNNELLEYIYRDAEMSCFSLTELLKDLKGKDNKITPTVENILKGYKRYMQEAEEKLKEANVELKKTSPMARMASSMGVKQEVKKDNSDASIADMLIKGISMGTLDMEKRINNYKADAKKDILGFAKDFYKFQQDNLESLKSFL